MIEHGQDSLLFADTLAWHFSSAGEFDQAAHYSLLAGQYAAQLYAPLQAISYLKKPYAGNQNKLRQRIQIYLPKPILDWQKHCG